MLKTTQCIFLLGLLLLAACSPTPAGQNLVGTSWVLVSLDGNSQVGAALGGQDVTLDFVSSTVSGGSGGCNSFGGAYEASSSTGSIAFSNLVVTLMACTAAGVDAVETAYFAALNAAERYEVNGNTLTISGGGHTMVFERTAQES